MLLWYATSSSEVSRVNAAYHAPRSGPLKRLPKGLAWVNAAFTICEYERPKTSSRTVIPGSKPASPASLSLVAPSSSNSAFKSSTSSVSRVRTLSSRSPWRAGIKRCVSSRRTSETWGSNLSPTAARIQELPHPQHRRQPTFDHVGKRGLPFKHRIVVRQLNPLIGELLAVEDVQGLENPCQQRNPRQPILVECATRFFLPFIKSAIRDASQQLPRVFIAQLPKLSNFQERLYRRRAQSLQHVFPRKIGWSFPGNARRQLMDGCQWASSLRSPYMEHYTSIIGCTQSLAHLAGQLC